MVSKFFNIYWSDLTDEKQEIILESVIDSLIEQGFKGDLENEAKEVIGKFFYGKISIES